MNPFLMEGLSRKIIVHDDCAQSGEFTRRLLILMKCYARRALGCPLSHIYVEPPLHTEYGYDGELDVNFAPFTRNEDYMFREEGGKLAAGDRHLVIGVTRDGQGFLASY